MSNNNYYHKKLMKRKNLPSARLDTRGNGFGACKVELLNAVEDFSAMITNLPNGLFIHPDVKDFFRLINQIIYEVEKDPACMPALQKAVDDFNKYEGRTPIPDPAKCGHEKRSRHLGRYNHGYYVEEDCALCGKRNIKSEKVDWSYTLTNDKEKLKEFLENFKYKDE